MQDLTKLIRCDSDDLPENLLGLAIRLENPGKNNPHSAIFIRYNSQNYLFHFTGNGQKVYLTTAINNDWFLFKALTNVNFFIPSIFAHFRRIKTKSKPAYFYFYGGGLFDSNGDYVDNEGLPNYMTCVGFCLAALKQTLSTDLLKFDEWPSGKIKGKPEDFVELFYKKKVAPNYPDISLELFSKNVRRISPLEYITAGFSDSFPASKTFVETSKQRIKESILHSINTWEYND